DLVGPVVEIVLPRELLPDRLAQRQDALDVGVFRLVPLHRFPGSALHVLRRGKVGFAVGEADDVAPFGAQLAHPRGDELARARLETAHARGEGDRGHRLRAPWECRRGASYVRPPPGKSRIGGGTVCSGEACRAALDRPAAIPT